MKPPIDIRDKRMENEFESTVRAIRQAMDVATMHLELRDAKIQIAALVLSDELLELAKHPDVVAYDGKLALIKLKLQAVRTLALDINLVCGGKK